MTDKNETESLPKRRYNKNRKKKTRPMPVTKVGEKPSQEEIVVERPRDPDKGFTGTQTDVSTRAQFPLGNPRFEMFAQNVAIGMSLVDAHEQCGYARRSGNASTMFAKQEIQDRVKYIQENMVANRHAVIMHKSSEIGDVTTQEAMLELGITKAYLLAHLQNNVVLAQEVGQISASNKAIAMLWSALNEGNPGDPDAQAGRPGHNKPVELNVLLNFAEKLNQKPPVVTIEDEDIRLVDDDDLKDVSE